MMRCLCLLVCVVGAFADDAPEKIVYGSDDRIEFYQATAAVQAIVSEAIVSLTQYGYLSCTDTTCDWLVTSSSPLCPDEAFSEQQMLTSCSGTLIASNKIVTAGHCVGVDSDCDSMGILFNYHYESAGNLQSLTPDDLYRCAAYYKYESTNINGEFVDYAVIVLDRDVSSDKVPMVMATSTDTKPAENTMLTLAGYPSGLPMKALQDAVQYNAADRPNFDAWYSDCDTFGGNSGSGVFDVANRKLWGILSSGNTDYVMDGGCERANVVADSSGFGGIGEIICYPFPANDLLPVTCTDCAGVSSASCVNNFCQVYSNPDVTYSGTPTNPTDDTDGSTDDGSDDGDDVDDGGDEDSTGNSTETDDSDNDSGNETAGDETDGTDGDGTDGTDGDGTDGTDGDGTDGTDGDGTDGTDGDGTDGTDGDGTNGTDGDGTDDNSTGGDVVFTCDQAIELFDNTNMCCLPVAHDGSVVCDAYLYVHLSCAHENFDMTSNERTCASDQVWASDSDSECVSCDCGHTACGIRSPASALVPSFLLALLAALLM